MTVELLQAKADRLTEFLRTLPGHAGADALRASTQESLDETNAQIEALSQKPGPGEGPIAWPSDDPVVNPRIAEAVGSVVDRGLLPEGERQKITAGGPRSFFQPERFFKAPNENGYTPGDVQEQVRPTFPIAIAIGKSKITELEQAMTQLENEHKQKIAELQAKYTVHTAPVRPKTKIPANPKIGVVICTYGSVPYVHLGLEALRRNEPDVPVLIHDDCSPDQDKLRNLAAQYGASVVSTISRRVPTVGDLSGFVRALEWGNNAGLDVVVKLSRRFLINKPWSADLGAILHNTQYATACAPDSAWQWGMRSEAVGMHVRSWIDSGAMARMDEAVRANVQPHPLPEAFVHECARDVHKWLHPEDELVSHWNERDHPDCDWTVRSEKTFNRPVNYDSYVWWVSVMGLARTQLIPDVYWHDSWSNREYGAFARSIGLPYSDDDFYTEPGS